MAGTFRLVPVPLVAPWLRLPSPLVGTGLADLPHPDLGQFGPRLEGWSF